MIVVLIPLLFLPILLALYLYRLAGLTRRADPTLQVSLDGTCAGGILDILESSSHTNMMQRLSPSERRSFGRDFMSRVLPRLFCEARQVTVAARHPLALVHFGLFCLAYGIVWCKVRLWAEVEDLRYLLGAEASLLHTASLVPK